MLVDDDDDLPPSSVVAAAAVASLDQFLFLLPSNKGLLHSHSLPVQIFV